MPRAIGLSGPLLIAAIAGCARSEGVAHGRLLLTVAPRDVAFTHEVSAWGPSRELCLEFARPADSRSADRIRAVLIGADGRRDTFFVSELDRRGEALVCLVDRETDRVNDTPPMRYRAIELRSEVPLEIRAVRWHGGERRQSR